jgi:hypothetical protein
MIFYKIYVKIKEIILNNHPNRQFPHIFQSNQKDLTHILLTYSSIDPGHNFSTQNHNNPPVLVLRVAVVSEG